MKWNFISALDAFVRSPTVLPDHRSGGDENSLVHSVEHKGETLGTEVQRELKLCLITETNFGDSKDNLEVLGKDREKECFKDLTDPS